jgi:hypothetical protein
MLLNKTAENDAASFRLAGSEGDGAGLHQSID